MGGGLGQAQTNESVAEAESQTAAMAESAKFMVIHMNRAAGASSLAAAQAEAALARKFGQEMVAKGRKAVVKVEQALATPKTSSETLQIGTQAVCYLREAIRHVHHVLQHTHHIEMSDSLRGGIAHVADGARHARSSGNSVITGQSYLALLAKSASPGKSSPSVVAAARRLPFCGFGEESQHDREIFLDAAEGHGGHGAPSSGDHR
jgi:hypothetical protein